jgi:ribulose kinase
VVSLTQSHIEVLGAALLAGVSQGLYPDLTSAIDRIVVPGKEFSPNAEAHAAYNRLFPMYKKLYTEVQHHFEELAKMDLPQVWITQGNKI